MSRTAKISTCLIAAAAGTMLFAPQAAKASEASADFRLRLRVPLYCIVEASEQSSVNLVDGSADLGMVREVCNRARGHDVTATFSNLAEGLLEVEGERFAVDEGMVRISSNGARARKSAWRLSQAKAKVEGTPIFMRVSITPR